MHKQNPLTALLWLLLIPAQLIAGALFILLGTVLDSYIFSGAGSGQGHPAPFLTLIFALLAGGATVIIIIVSIVLTIVHLVKNLRQNNAS